MIETKKICGNCGTVGYSVNNYSDFMRCFLSALPSILSAIYYPEAIFACIAGSIVLYLFVLNKRNKCPICNAQNTMINISTTRGKELYLKNNNEQAYQEEVKQLTKVIKTTKTNLIFVFFILLSFVISIILPPIIKGYNNAAERASRVEDGDFDWREQLERDRRQQQEEIYYKQLELEKQQQMELERRNSEREFSGSVGAIVGGIVGWGLGALVGDFGGVVGAPAGAAVGKSLGQMFYDEQ